MASPSAARPRPTGGILATVRQLGEQLGRPADRPARRVDHGDVRARVLVALAEEPGSGYDVVRRLAAGDTGGPGAGAVYPVLQLLVDEGLVTVTETDDRRIHALTPAGRTAAEAARARAVLDAPSLPLGPVRPGALPRAGAQLAAATALIAQSGSRELIAEAVVVLDEARRKLYAILART